MTGVKSQCIGIVLQGELDALKVTPAGQQFTLSSFKKGGVFGDILSANRTKSPVSIAAKTDGKLLWITSPLHVSPPAGYELLFCRLHSNLSREMAKKYFLLDNRIDLLLIPRLRKRIAHYLVKEHRHQQGFFRLPFSRTAFAQHLGCDRSALSREISRMVKDGILHVQGRYLCIPDINLLTYIADFSD